MWLFTQRGFYSVVSADEDGRIMVRGRVKADLEALLPLIEPLGRGREVIESRHADYRYRIVIEPDEWAAIVTALAAEVDYGNFKARVASLNPRRAETYHRIWDIHYRDLPLEDLAT